MADTLKGTTASKDPGGMKGAFGNVGHTRLDEDMPKEKPKTEDSGGGFFESLGSRINRGIKSTKKKLGG